MKKIISIVKDERIVAIVGKTMTAMIYERCTLVTLPFIPLPPLANVNTEAAVQVCTVHSPQVSYQTTFISIAHWKEERGLQNNIDIDENRELRPIAAVKQ